MGRDDRNRKARQGCPPVRGNLKEAEAVSSDSTNRNRIQGRRGGVIRQWTETPESHSDTHAGKSGGRRAKEAQLTLGDLLVCPDEPDYRDGNGVGRTWEKSAEAVVVRLSNQRSQDPDMGRSNHASQERMKG